MLEIAMLSVWKVTYHKDSRGEVCQSVSRPLPNTGRASYISAVILPKIGAPQHGQVIEALRPGHEGCGLVDDIVLAAGDATPRAAVLLSNSNTS